MADWFIAPDGVTKTGLTFATIGSGAYGTAWNKAVKWSDFTLASGAWVNRANGDVFHFLACNKPFPISNGSGWTALSMNKTGVTFVGETIDGRKAMAVIKGTRDYPWPKAGETATYGGEVFANISVASANFVADHMAFRNLKTPFTPNAGSSADIGTVTLKDCHATNTSRGLFYTETRTDGRCNLVMTNCDLHGYDKGNGKTYANNAAVGIAASDCYFDSEHQNDNSHTSSASTPSGLHIFDANPIYQTVKSPMVITRVVSTNNRAGYVGSGYPQGDGMIGEENVGVFTGKDILTWGNGDRGIDLKCSGQIIRHTSFGDAYSTGHHLDTVPVDLTSCVYYTGARLSTATTPPAVACLQASGWIRAFRCWMDARATATQVALNAFALSSATVAGPAWQGQTYGGTHQGTVEMTDCYGRYKSSTGCTEQNGYAGTGITGRVGAVFGLTASTTRHFVVRALGPDWTAGPATSTPMTFALSADGGGERVGPAAPTNFVATAGADGRDIVCSWTNVAEDAGTSIQGYIVEVDAGDGAGFLPFLPAKSNTPLTLSGFRKGVAYTLRVRAFDANLNLGTVSSTQSVTTTAGTDTVDTPSVPQTVGVDGGWIAHVTAAGIGNSNSNVTSGFTAPATGTAAVYEILDSDNSNAVVARMGSIRTSAQDTPTLTKTNINLVAV